MCAFIKNTNRGHIVVGFQSGAWVMRMKRPLGYSIFGDAISGVPFQRGSVKVGTQSESEAVYLHTKID